MKQNIHPDYHEINLKLTDGTIVKTMSTYGKEGDTIVLDIDHLIHPAWTGVHKLVDTSGGLSKFNKKFSSFDKLSCPQYIGMHAFKTNTFVIISCAAL